MKHIFIIILLLAFSITNMTAQDLSKHQWQNRILIVQFDKVKQEKYVEQMRDLKTNQEGLTERKLIVYQVYDGMYRIGFDEKVEWKKAATSFLQKIDAKTNAEFTVLLIGLDGGIKVRQSKPLLMKELFGIIDAMPMRARELRNDENEP